MPSRTTACTNSWSHSLYQTRSVAREDREVFLRDPIVASAMAHSTVLSLPIALEALVPDLAAAVRAGDR